MTITAKNGNTPPSLQGNKSLAEVLDIIDLFVAFNNSRLVTATDKIAYYNKHSFYIVN